MRSCTFLPGMVASARIAGSGGRSPPGDSCTSDQTIEPGSAEPSSAGALLVEDRLLADGKRRASARARRRPAARQLRPHAPASGGAARRGGGVRRRRAGSPAAAFADAAACAPAAAAAGRRRTDGSAVGRRLVRRWPASPSRVVSAPSGVRRWVNLRLSFPGRRRFRRRRVFGRRRLRRGARGFSRRCRRERVVDGGSAAEAEQSPKASRVQPDAVAAAGDAPARIDRGDQQRRRSCACALRPAGAGTIVRRRLFRRWPSIAARRGCRSARPPLRIGDGRRRRLVGFGPRSACAGGSVRAAGSALALDRRGAAGRRWRRRCRPWTAWRLRQLVLRSVSSEANTSSSSAQRVGPARGAYSFSICDDGFFERALLAGRRRLGGRRRIDRRELCGDGGARLLVDAARASRAWFRPTRRASSSGPLRNLPFFVDL